MPATTKHPIRKRHRLLSEFVRIERKVPNDTRSDREIVAQALADFEGAPVKRKRKSAAGPGCPPEK